jgi:hypothetical protein
MPEMRGMPDESQLIGLVYMSTERIHFDIDKILDLIEVSRRRNAEDHITGLLCHHAGQFIQFLEGKAKDVDALMERICRDQRHTTPYVVYRKPILDRAFPDWSMALRLFDDMTPEQQKHCRNILAVSLQENASASRYRSDLDALLASFTYAIK